MKRPAEIMLLLQMIKEGYIQRTWHGPNLRGAIRGLTPREAAWRPAPKRHNIWEVVVHCAYWKYAVRRRILGEKKGMFPFKGSNWFHRPEETSSLAWKQDVKLLNEMHSKMVESISGLAPRDLKQNPKGSLWSIRSTLYGIAMHDVYHAGQIQLLKKIMK